MQAESKHNIPKQFDDYVALAAFLARRHTIDEIAFEFDLPVSEAEKAVQALYDQGFDVYPSAQAGRPAYVAVPTAKADTDKIRAQKRLWSWQASPSQPYGVLRFQNGFAPAKVKIVPIDGILFGDPAHDSKRFDALIDWLQDDPAAFAFLNGDIIAEVTEGSREEREGVLMDRTQEFVSKMAHVAHKILWAQRGCLEERSLKKQGFDPLEYFCVRLGIPYFHEPCYIDLYWQNNLFTVWAMHGASTAQLKGARMNALRRPAVMHDWTHFLVGGHVGDAIVNRSIKICRDPVAGKLVPREEFFVILGNFKKYLGTRAAQRGYAPPSIDSLVLCLYPDGSHHVRSAHAESLKHA